MGRWGFTSVENDAALDWLQNFFDNAGLAAYLEATLNFDLREHPNEIRVAAHFVYAVTKAELWPYDTQAKFTELAVIRLEHLLSENIFSDDNFVSEIRREINALSGLSHPLAKPTDSHDSGKPAP